MAALQCEICGGKLVGKPGGLFECEYCGVEYSTEWAKAKIQEIRGTVKVEGTVDVKGTVKIEGPVEIKGGVSIDNLIKRGQMALEDEDWERAEAAFEEALKIDAERGECYWGLLCARYAYPNADKLLRAKYNQLRTDRDFARAAKFSNSKRKAQIDVLEKTYIEQNKFQSEQTGETLLERNPYMARILPVQNLVACMDKAVVAVKIDGTLLVMKSGRLDRFDVERYEKLCRELAAWTDIVAVSASYHNVVGLKSDGTVVAASVLDNPPEIAVAGWRDIVAIDAGTRRTLGLKQDGTVVVAGQKEYFPDPMTMVTKYDLSGWKNMAVVGHLYLTDYGIRKDGSIVLGSWLGSDKDEARRVCQWKNIVALSADSEGVSSAAHWYKGLCPDGTILLSDGTHCGENIAMLYTAGHNAYALDKDGNVLEVRINGKLENYLMGQHVVAIAAQDFELICLKADGTLIRRTHSRISNDFEGWKLFESVDTIEQERKQHAEEKARREEKRREDAYEKAVNLLNSGAGIEDLKYAQELFVSLKNYRDAEQQCKHCWNKIQELQLEEKYQNACALMNRDQIPEVGKAMQEFQKISAWKDSREKIGQCQEKIAYLKKKAEINKELSKVCSERDALEKERSQLGIFSGKRKKELAAEIEKLDEEIARLEKQEKELK